MKCNFCGRQKATYFFEKNVKNSSINWDYLEVKCGVCNGFLGGCESCNHKGYASRKKIRKKYKNLIGLCHDCHCGLIGIMGKILSRREIETLKLLQC